MKKLLIVLGLITLLIATDVKAIEKPPLTDREEITIYLFRGAGCTHCQDAINAFNDLKGEYDDYFKVIAYETWENSANRILFDSVKEELEITEKGVPFIIIGDEYNLIGFNETYLDEIIEAALEAYTNANYVDVVQKVITKKSGDYQQENLKQACEAEDIKYYNHDTQNAQEKKADVYIILGIFAAIIGGISYLIITTNKKS